MGNPSNILELLPGEVEMKKVSGDCWRTPDMWSSSQVPGKYTFTDSRILFRGSGIIEALRVCFAIPYSEIDSIQTFMVALFPTGIQLTLKDGGIYKLSVMKRKEHIAFIEEQMRKCAERMA